VQQHAASGVDVVSPQEVDQATTFLSDLAWADYYDGGTIDLWWQLVTVMADANTGLEYKGLTWDGAWSYLNSQSCDSSESPCHLGL
jgi:hypothetical protein